MVRSGPERSGADRNGSERTGSDRIGPDRSGGPVLDGATFGVVWRTVAVANHGAHPLFLTGGWAQQQGEEEEGGKGRRDGEGEGSEQG